MTATVLRVHAPEACDSTGRPYGWLVCTDCTDGVAYRGATVRPCATCAGTVRLRRGRCRSTSSAAATAG